MGNIKDLIPHMVGIDGEITQALIDFYEYMKELENDPERGGKQATLIVMVVEDLKDIFEK